ncbi:MCE family protein [Actinomadura barringtoniae]|uniref:MCE family protein n=1 Tax=Actinomadura barringtoniae TaxID=1427535 RepID=A0A939PGC0_9ACTN|nr:MCE family protein [Actinomadura barringtoniae]MBO2447976.1 MCE family protein [Actinomadura barringtoniae]
MTTSGATSGAPSGATPGAAKLPPLKKRRRRWKPLRERNPIPVALIGLVLLLLFGMTAYRADDLPIIGGGVTYHAYFSEAAGLKSGQEVRVAGVKVGKVTDVSLDGAKVKVSFRVKGTWVGDRSTAMIMIKTLLGSKYLSLDPLGAAKQDPKQAIGLDRTVAPYDVTTAFEDLGRTFQDIDTPRLAQSLTTISQTFKDTPPDVRKAFNGLSQLSRTIASRDAELQSLLAGTKRLSGTLADQNSQFEVLFKDGNLLLAELRRRRDAIHELLVATQRMARALSDLVDDNRGQLGPMLDALDRVTDTLMRHQKSLEQAIKVSAPYTRLIGNATGNGRWIDGYLCGTVPKDYIKSNPDAGVISRWEGPATGCKPPHLTGGGS